MYSASCQCFKWKNRCFTIMRKTKCVAFFSIRILCVRFHFRSVSCSSKWIFIVRFSSKILIRLYFTKFTIIQVKNWYGTRLWLTRHVPFIFFYLSQQALYEILLDYILQNKSFSFSTIPVKNMTWIIMEIPCHLSRFCFPCWNIIRALDKFKSWNFHG